MFWSVLTHFKMFSLVVNSLERFLYVLRHFMKFWGSFSLVLSRFETFLTFSDGQRCSEAY